MGPFTNPRGLSTLAICVIIFIVFHGIFEPSHAEPHWLDRVDMNSSTIWVVQLPQELAELSDPSAALEKLAHEHGCHVLGRVANLKDHFALMHDPHHKNKRSIEDVDMSLLDHPYVEWAEMQTPRYHEKRFRPINDPLWPDQWHLHGNGGVDLNVLPAWESGLSGHGVGINVADDGLEWFHPDLGAVRFLREGSRDWNNGVDDPKPKIADDTHGTACGGLAYAGLNNGICGVGIAFGSKFGAQRLISGPTNDAMEATGLTFRTDINHIFSSSWGPTDDAKRKEGMGKVLRAAIANAVTTGRNGLGTIYVWAGGNGGSKKDNVNYDGYANSIYTIAIASITKDGKKAYYSEEGAALVVGATSSPPGVATTAVNYQCTKRFGGTSASSPMIAGGIALMLEANPTLNWREVQDILVRTARKNDPDDSDWAVNGAGLHVNHKYGFGLADIGAATALAADPSYRRLPPKINPPAQASWSGSLAVPDNNNVGVSVELNIADNFIVEHVELLINATHFHIGEMNINLRSPAGTISVLAVTHPDPHSEYKNWTFTSMRHWGEQAMGKWKVTVFDETSGGEGTLRSLQLIVHGHHE